jgi:hypothetical protein
MKKFLGIVVLGLLLSGNAYSKNITILFSNENEVALLSKQTPLSDKVFFRANAAGAEHCKKFKKYVFKSRHYGVRKTEIEKHYINEGYKIGKGFSKKPQLQYFVCSKTPLNFLPSWASFDVGNEVDYTNYGDNSVARLIQEEEDKKKIAEKPKKQEPENIKINIHQVLLNQELVINFEGKNWILQFLRNGQIISTYDNKTHRDFRWKKINNNGLYDMYYKKDKKANLYDIDFENGTMKETAWRDNNTYTYKILSPKYENLIAEKPKKKKPKSSPDDDKIVPAGSGSGFFVSKEGHAITNYHVIEGCDINKLSFKGSQTEVKVLAIDKVNDIAILKTNAEPDVIFPVSNEDVSLLEDVIVAGFPLGKQISSAIKTHKGVVTALAGAGDNYSFFQTDAAINQGNSGGPIINQKGNVVGIAVATWVEEGVQGVHFGIKSSILKTFASANGLIFSSPNLRERSNKDLGELITKGTVYVECHMTIAKIKKMIADTQNKKAFFSEYQ